MHRFFIANPGVPHWWPAARIQWYGNVLNNPSIRIDARGAEADFRATPITEARAVKFAVEKFREKYGAKDVQRYYSQFDLAVVVHLAEMEACCLRCWVRPRR